MADTNITTTEGVSTNELIESNSSLLRESDITSGDSLRTSIFESSSLIYDQMRSQGIYQPSDMKYKEQFYRFKRIDPLFR